MSKRLISTVLLIMGLVLFLLPAFTHAWPTANDWIGLVNAAGFVDDPDSDFNQCHLDIVGDSLSNPAVMLYNDGDYIYYRIRLDCDPGQAGYLKQNTWGILIDTDQNADSYEWMARIDGRPTDDIVISQNTVQGTLGDPSDSAEIDVWNDPLVSTPGSENFKITSAGMNFPTSAPDPDYWLEYRYPYDVWLYYMGLDDNSVIRYFVGTGTSGSTLSGDIVGTSLYTSLSSPILPSGTTPTTGTVMFVDDILGNGDATEIYPGETLFVKVEDGDRNSQLTAIETITVVINTPSGDSEEVVLTETGISTGIFTGSIATQDVLPAIVNGGTLEVSPIESVFVTYVDAVDANLDKNRERYDTLIAQPMADIAITKTVSNSTPNEDDMIAFTLIANNLGASDAFNIKVTDILDADFIYNSDDGGGSYNSTNGVWTIPTLLDMDSSTLIINAIVNSGTAGTSIDNTAYISYNPQLDPDTSNDTDTVSVTVQGADLDLSKIVDIITPGEGGLIKYTLTLSNLGSNDATGIIINDVISGDLIFSSDNPSVGSYDNATGRWDGFTLVTGASATLEIFANVNAGTSGKVVTNYANVFYSDQADPVSSNNTAYASIAVDGVELGLTKIANTTTLDVGQDVIFTVTLSNDGTNTATNISVLDSLPAGLSYSSDIANAGAYNSGTGVWTLASLGAGLSEWLEITTTVDPGYGGSTLTNVAQLTAFSETDLSPINNSASASVTVKSADLSITKTVDEPSPDPSSEVGFTVTVTNNGPDDVTGIEVTDLLPAGLTYLNNTPAPSGNYDSATGIWDGFSLASGASAVLLVNASVPGTVGTIETNIATITGSGTEDLNAINNTASATITVGGVDLRLTKTVDNPAPAEGDAIIYTITVENIGDFPATGIEIVDSLPSGVTYSGTSATQGSYKVATSTWKTLSIVNGSSATLTIDATVDTGTNGSVIENSARISVVSETDINIINNLGKVSIYVGSTDLQVTKTVDDATPTEGDLVIYTITVENMGLNNAVGVEVTDLLPAGLIYNSNDAGGFYNTVNGVWNVTTPGDTFILPSGSRTLILNGIVNSGTYGQTIYNFADITATGQLDPNGANDLASASITVQGADISVQKTADIATPNEGDTVKFTLTVLNNGPHTASGVLVQDVIPPGLTYVDDDSGGAFVNASGLWAIGSLTKFSAVTLVINTVADIGTGGTTITNIANVVSADQVDPVSINNTVSFDVSPVSIPFPDFDFRKSVLTFWDPINLNNGNQKSIPGAVMIYDLQATNRGDGSPDADVVQIVEAVPANTELFVGDYGGAGSGPLEYADGFIPSDLTYSFLGITNSSDSIEFSNDGGTLYDYDPNDATGYDPAVTHFRVNFDGVFDLSDGISHPFFNLRFKVRVK